VCTSAPNKRNKTLPADNIKRVKAISVVERTANYPMSSSVMSAVIFMIFDKMPTFQVNVCLSRLRVFGTKRFYIKKIFLIIKGQSALFHLWYINRLTSLFHGINMRSESFPIYESCTFDIIYKRYSQLTKAILFSICALFMD
jgi:hypothetical protein